VTLDSFLNPFEAQCLDSKWRKKGFSYLGGWREVKIKKSMELGLLLPLILQELAIIITGSQ
jgi:hypothetical protein